MRRQLWHAILSGSLVLLVGAPASAFDQAACEEAQASGKKLRADGQLTGARAAFQTCADASCPDAIRAECTNLGDAVEKLVPTVVLVARDDKGQDLATARVEVDGKPFVDSLTGRAVPIDPGPHVLRLTSPGVEPALQRVVVNEGEKGRLVVFTVTRAAPAPAPVIVPVPTPTPMPTENPPARTARGHGSGPWIVGSLGLGAAVAGVGFLKRAGDIQKQVDEGCAKYFDPNISCEQDSRKSDAQSAALVSFIAAGALLGGGLIWYALEPVDKPPRPPSSAPWILGAAGIVAVVAGGVTATIGAAGTKTDTTTDFLPTGLGVATAGAAMIATGLVWKLTETKSASADARRVSPGPTGVRVDF
jgi:hypothetical protein